MTLKDYLDKKFKSAAEVARLADVSLPTVTRIRDGEQNVSRVVIRRIIEATDGAVSAEEIVWAQQKGEAA